jgi:hypothetical protein
MRRVDYRDFVGGILIILFGLGALYHSVTSYNMGTLSRMGPGYFPALVSGLLVICGLGVFIPSLLRAGPRINFDFKPFFWISLSVLVFAVLLLPFGLVAAIFAQTIIAGLSDRKLSLVGSLILAAGLAVGATLIFQVGLGMTLPIFAWPW